MHREGKLWVVVLAGGEGRRLRELARDSDGGAIPKQFSRLDGAESLLGLARARARRLTDPDRVITVVMERHRRWWEPELTPPGTGETLVQPVPRGTGIAILHALLEILRRDQAPLLAILPSDHAAQDEAALDGAVERTVSAAQECPGDLVALGMPADAADPQYGWLLPGAAVDGATRAVISLEEKPTPARAASLLERGAVINSFIVSATGEAMLALFRSVRPRLLRTYTAGRQASGWSAEGVEHVFRRLPVVDFVLDVMAESLSRVRVLAAPDCGWIDVGTPERLRRWRERKQVQRA
jgi:mannose-1-phosphate guanylyltransferase